jgi:hypothetical protein
MRRSMGDNFPSRKSVSTALILWPRVIRGTFGLGIGCGDAVESAGNTGDADGEISNSESWLAGVNGVLNLNELELPKDLNDSGDAASGESENAVLPGVEKKDRLLEGVEDETENDPNGEPL